MSRYIWHALQRESEALQAARPIGAGAYPGFCSMKRLEVFLLPLDGMLVHRRSLPRKLSGFPQQFAGTHLYTWVERGTVRVKCLAQEHNTMSPARARTRSACSGVEHTNHEATAPPTLQKEAVIKGEVTAIKYHPSAISTCSRWIRNTYCGDCEMG